MTELFNECHSLTSVNIQNLKTDYVSSFNSMFHNCYNLKSIDVSHFNIKQHAGFKKMFSGCFSLTSVYFTKTQNSNLEPSFDVIVLI